MIKFETIHAFQVAKNNPVMKSDKDVSNYSFMTENDILYFVCNTIVGDDAYLEDVKIPAGEFLNGFDVKSLEGLKLVADMKHVKDADYAAVVAGTTMMVANADGMLEVASAAPAAGPYFLVTEKCRLTENAVKLLVKVA